jgi:uncharacterized protein (DUF58 family)
LGFSAVNTGNNLIYLIVSVLLGLMGVSGFFGRSNLSRLDIFIDFPDELFAATHSLVKITLVNRRSILPAFLINVRIDNREVLFPFVSAKGTAAKYMDFYFPRRGSYRLESLYLSSRYPFNFFTRYKSIAGAYEGVVFPQVKKCGLYDFIKNQTMRGGERYANKSGYDGEMISIRSYTSGDPYKYINWKSSAKTGELKTKEFSMAVHQPVIIDFNRVDIPDIEERISCITYFIIKSFRNNIPVGLKIKDMVYTPGLSKTHKTSMLRELALYGET